MVTNDEGRAAREAKLEYLHDTLATTVEALVSAEDWVRAVEFAARFRSRSFNNTLLIWVQHEAAFEAGRVPNPVPSYVAGYRQWQQLGRQVQKGQPGYMIFAPVHEHVEIGPPRRAQSDKPPAEQSAGRHMAPPARSWFTPEPITEVTEQRGLSR